MSYYHKTIKRISVSWSENHDKHIRSILGDSGVYQAPWISSRNPPEGFPKTGFNIRSQSRWETGIIYMDFDNIPYFYRDDQNPQAILWVDQLPIILKALNAAGVDMADQSIVDLREYPEKPRDIPIKTNQLLEFINKLNELIK